MGKHSRTKADRQELEFANAAEWAEEMERLHRRIGPRFYRLEARERSRRYLEALVGRVDRKNCWQLAEYSREATPDGMQRLLSTAAWDADEARDDLREYVVDRLGEEDAVLVVDETGFLKKGTKSVGVKRQYSGTAGRIENCQVGVFLAYATSKGRAFIDRELYLPEEWAEDRDRRKEAGVPVEVEFATKPEIAHRMLERAFEAGVKVGWVTGDEVYGGDWKLRSYLQGRGQPYVLAVKSNAMVSPMEELSLSRIAVSEIAAEFKGGDWKRLSVGNGAKGPRAYDWARVELAWIAEEGFRHWLLVRRKVEDPKEFAYYLVYAPADTSLAKTARAAGRRWAIEEAIERAKGEAGLDEYEVRSWTGWYRHITLSLLAHAFLVVTRAHMSEASSEKRGARAA